MSTAVDMQDPQNQQELPPWKSEESTRAGVDAARVSYSNGQSAVLKNGEATGEDKCCKRCVGKCGPIGWYFSPIMDKVGYSLIASFYHLLMFPYTLAVMIIVITLWSVSVGLLILIFGFILYWFTCEISVVFARIDLALAYYCVEDNEDTLLSRGRSVRLSLYKELGPCPCSSSSSEKCCAALWTRMKSIALHANTYKILVFQMIFKPIIVGLTCWIFIIVVYNIASVFAPIVYICYPPVFTKHYWCPFTGTSCNDGKCRCEVVGVEDFGGALLYGFCSLLLLPITMRVSIWFAKASKAISYVFLSDYYKKNKNEEIGNLLAGNKHVSNESVSIDGAKSTETTQPAIVHSLNNPYMDTQV